MFEGYSERARIVLFVARSKAGQRGAGSIHVDDVLLGILYEHQGRVADVVPEFKRPLAGVGGGHRGRLGTIAEKAIQEIEARLPRQEPKPPETDMALSEDAKAVLAEASRLMEEGGKSMVEPLHILAAGLGGGSGVGVEVLGKLGVTAEAAILAIKKRRPEL